MDSRTLIYYNHAQHGSRDASEKRRSTTGSPAGSMSIQHKRNPPTNSDEPEYQLTREGDGWVARDLDTGITSQGGTPHHALEMLQEALQLYHATDETLSDDEELAALAELGIDPTEVKQSRSENDGLPDCMQ